MYSFFCRAVAASVVYSVSALAEQTVIPDPKWEVARAQFTTAIENREPVDEVVVLAPPSDEVFFFTDLRNLEGRTITHRWEYQGQLVSQKDFDVGGARWRVYSKIRIEPAQVGEWSVTVVDQSGWPLYIELFRYNSLRQTGAARTPREDQ